MRRTVRPALQKCSSSASCGLFFYTLSLNVFGANLYTRTLAAIQYRTQKRMVIPPKIMVDIRICIIKKHMKYVTIVTMRYVALLISVPAFYGCSR